MAQIRVSELTFRYEGQEDTVFEKVSFSIDTNWRLGFIGRNGKGKTTFLHLLQGKYEYQGVVTAPVYVSYFPYKVKAGDMERFAAELFTEWKPECEEWKVICELEQLGAGAEILYRPFCTLSSGERTKVMLAVLFSSENDFLLIDEPTNHLDGDSRELVKQYLASKKGFILVSHDRELLDVCIDHVLVLNRKTIEVQTGNFSSWWENKTRKDAFAQAENEKRLKEIGKLQKAAKRSAQWADQNERTKIGFDPLKETDRGISTRAYIGAKTKKMQSRVKQMKNRMEREIKEKENLLQDIETVMDLKLNPLPYHKQILVLARDYGLRYQDAQKPLFSGVSMEIRQGERIALSGRNGCGKTTLLKMMLEKADGLQRTTDLIETGSLNVGAGLMTSYVNQDASMLHGNLDRFCEERELDKSLFCSVLSQLGLERIQFSKPLEEYSEGQKKKALIAASLLTPAHLYIWDEPLNYMDIFSRMQVEKLLLEYQPTMLFVEHDAYFRNKIATRVITL